MLILRNVVGTARFEQNLDGLLPAEATRIHEEIIQFWRDNRDLARVLSAADSDSDADASGVTEGTGAR
jgi:hypothetical protein